MTAKVESNADAQPKGRLQRVERPDINERNAQLETIKARIDVLDKKLKGVYDKLENSSGDRKEFQTTRREMRKKLDEFGEIIDAREAEKQRIVDLLKRENSKKRDAQDEMKKQQSRLGLKTPHDIDTRIAALEHQMMTSVMPLSEEKGIIQKIKELKVAKTQLTSTSASLHGSDTTAKLEAQLEVVKQEIKDAKDAKREQQKHLQELTAARNQVDDGSNELYKERDALKKQIDAEYNKKKAVLDDFKAKMATFHEYMAQTKAAREEKWRADNLAWEAQKAREKASQLETEDEVHPYCDNMLMLEQTIKYCDGLLNPGKRDQKKEEVKETNHNNPEGSEVLLTKKQRDEAAQSGFAKGRGTKKDRMMAKAAQQTASNEVKEDARIKHDFVSIESFRKCKVDIPLTRKDIAPILEKLHAELSDYKVKVEEWKAGQDERAAARKAEMAELLAKAKDLDEQAAAARENIKARERGDLQDE